MQEQKKRLVELYNRDFDVVGLGHFGYKNVLSGLYLEMIWNYSDEEWKEYIEWANTVVKKYKDNRKSKSHLGFEKMYRRQVAKPREVKLKFDVSSLLPKHLKGKHKYKIWVTNSIWNGMNLCNLLNRFTVHRVGGMYGKFSINGNGKYCLSRHGQDLLRKRRLKKQTTDVKE